MDRSELIIARQRKGAQAKGELPRVEAIEIIYNGYIDAGRRTETPETKRAEDKLEVMIERLLPTDIKMQTEFFDECLELANASRKQGVIAGFAFAAEMMQNCRSKECQ